MSYIVYRIPYVVYRISCIVHCACSSCLYVSVKLKYNLNKKSEAKKEMFNVPSNCSIIFKGYTAPPAPLYFLLMHLLTPASSHKEALFTYCLFLFDSGRSMM